MAFNRYLGDCHICQKPVYIGTPYEPADPETNIGVVHQDCFFAEYTADIKNCRLNMLDNDNSEILDCHCK